MTSRPHTHLERGPLTFVSLTALVLCVLLSLAGCSMLAMDEISRRGGKPYYDQRSFVLVDGRYSYESDGIVANKTGVDVADHQGPINWDAVAADGIDFAMIRVGYRGTTEGGLYTDECFEENLLGAREAGIECGVYFFSQATSAEEAKEEAAFVLDLISGHPLEYPVALDYEIAPNTRIARVDRQTASQVADAFCAAIRLGGYTPMLYGNTYDLAAFDEKTIDDCLIWCAEYDEGPSFASKTDMWQYTEAGVVSGIGTLVDLNLDLSDA